LWITRNAKKGRGPTGPQPFSADRCVAELLHGHFFGLSFEVSLDGHWLLGTGLLTHLAAPLEEHALVDHEPSRLDVPLDVGTGLQLDLVRRVDVAEEFPSDDGVLHRHVGSHDTRLADDQGLRALDLAVEVSIDSDGSSELDVALDLAARAENGVEVALAAAAAEAIRFLAKHAIILLLRDCGQDARRLHANPQ